jgi:hypothetical protein
MLQIKIAVVMIGVISTLVRRKGGGSVGGLSNGDCPRYMNLLLPTG